MTLCEYTCRLKMVMKNEIHQLVVLSRAYVFLIQFHLLYSAQRASAPSNTIASIFIVSKIAKSISSTAVEGFLTTLPFSNSTCAGQKRTVGFNEKVDYLISSPVDLNFGWSRIKRTRFKTIKSVDLIYNHLFSFTFSNLEVKSFLNFSFLLVHAFIIIF